MVVMKARKQVLGGDGSTPAKSVEIPPWSLAGVEAWNLRRGCDDASSAAWARDGSRSSPRCGVVGVPARGTIASWRGYRLGSGWRASTVLMMMVDHGGARGSTSWPRSGDDASNGKNHNANTPSADGDCARAAVGTTTGWIHPVLEVRGLDAWVAGAYK